MERLLAPPLPPGCPWSGYRPPNVDWCEEELCGWVVNPADTWSNLAYLLVAAAMVLGARKHAGRGIRFFGPAAVVVGVCSGVYHASYTYILQLLDFLGMYVFCFLLIVQNAERLGWVRESALLRPFVGGVLVFTGITPLLFETGIPIQGLVLVLILLAVGQEFALFRRHGREAAPYGIFGLALVLLSAAAIFSLLDVTRTWCDPSDHVFQGHAVWHVLTAAALLALFHFYRGLSSSR